MKLRTKLSKASTMRILHTLLGIIYALAIVIAIAWLGSP